MKSITDYVVGALINHGRGMAGNAISSVAKAVGQSAHSSAGQVLCNNLLGLNENIAVSRCKTLSFKTRVLVRDAKSFVGSKDIKLDRINLHIKNDKIVKAYIG
jgi:hypothetical protein